MGALSTIEAAAAERAGAANVDQVQAWAKIN
jgi:hypothetical protein